MTQTREPGKHRSLARRLRYRVEYAVALGALWAFGALSLPTALRLSNWIGRAAFALLASRRRVAIENVLRAGIASDPGSARRVARASFVHFANLIVEYFKARGAAGADWQSGFEWDIPAETAALLDRPEQGLIVVSAHLGNWDIAGRCLSLRKPVTAIARPQNNPLVERLVARYRPIGRYQQIPKHGLNPRRFLTILKDGHILAILTDQHAGDHGVSVRFFGVPASTHSIAARLHVRTGAPLIVGTVIRLGPLRYRLTLSRPLEAPPAADREAQVLAILEAVNRQLEAAIRKWPEQYLWAHRRWRGTAAMDRPPAITPG